MVVALYSLFTSRSNNVRQRQLRAEWTKQQLWELLEQTKGLVQKNPQQARQLLIHNAGLTKAIFQAQIILGIIKTPQMQNMEAM